MRNFGIAIRSEVFALVAADQRGAAQIAEASNGLRELTFGDAETSRDRTAIQAVDFHGVPIPEKPPYKPPLPPPEGWSDDPLIRAAQKIAYGHAWDEHSADFPDIANKAQFAEFIYQKMQRAIGAPVIYDPEDNVLIIRETHDPIQRRVEPRISRNQRSPTM